MKIQTPVEAYGAMAQVPYTQEIESLLTVEDRFGEVYRMYDHEPGQPYCLIPRGLVNRLDAKHDFTVVNPVAQSLATAPPQTQDQAQVIEKSLALLQQGVDHIVEAPTGFGKTYVGCEVANRLGQATLIIVTKNDLVKGWKDTLVHLLGVSPKQIGHVQQNKQTYKGCRFVVAMIHSLVEREYDPEFYKYFGLVIFDEVHRLGADYFVQACKLFPAQHRLGLSATPDRADGRQKVFHAHIGPVMVTGKWIPMEPKVLVRKTGWKPPMVNRRDHVTGMWTRQPMELVPGKLMPVITRMAADHHRNSEIVQFVVDAYSHGRWTLILSELIEGHLQPLFFLLTKAGIPGEDIGYYIGGMKDAELAHTKKKKVVLGTYKMVSEGTNVPHWDTLVMATPRAQVKQPVGRVLRYVEGKRKPVVLDLVDNHPLLQGFYYSRLKQYYSLNGEIVEV